MIIDSQSFESALLLFPVVVAHMTKAAKAKYIKESGPGPWGKLRQVPCVEEREKREKARE